MSAEIVSLRRARKAKARAEDEARAAANRAAFGRTKAQKRLDAANESLAARRLESHRRDGADPAPGDARQQADARDREA